LAALIPGKPRALDEAQGEAGLRTLLRSLRPELDWDNIAPSVSPHDPAPWTRAIDEKTRLVVLSPVAPYTGAYRDPGAALARAAQVGAEVALDLRALLGVLPFVMPDPAPALVLGWSQGWLCGGAGLCFFWVRPDLARLFAAKLGQDTWPEPISKEALRLALAGMDLLGQVGAASIYAQSQRQTQRLLEGVLARGFPSLSPRDPAQRGGIVSVAPPHFEAVARALEAHRVLVGAQAGVGIQVAPHVYTQDHEIDLFLSTLDQVIDRLEFERFLRPSRVALP
jgi:selenocysteine lyase/cysteine desulfurase